MVRAKMKCCSVELFEGARTVKLTAVANNSPENATWSKYTPSGAVTLSITNPEAFEQFEVGKEYFVDFAPVLTST